MLRSSPTQKQEQQLSYFLCSCGEEFDFYNDYYNHLMQEMGLSQQKPIHQQSNNYPNCSILSAVKFEHEQDLYASEEQTILEARFSDQEEYLKSEESEGEQSIQNQMKSAASSLLGTPVKQQRRVLKRCNDFLLIKNQKCKTWPFYCGNCEIIYFQIEHFVIHCVQQCHTFDHPDSSHFITDQQQQRRRRNMLDRKRYSQRKLDLPRCESILDDLSCQPFNEIFRQCLDHRNLPFYCGLCEYNFISCKSYTQHIKAHLQKIHPYSSHVMLRINISGQNTRKYRFLYLSPHVQWINQEEKYYCSCEPKVKTTMAKLLKHIQQVHYGISPAYQGNFQRWPKRSIKTKMNGIDNGEENDYAQLKRIFNNRCDHRNMDFYCGGCQFKTKDPRNYIFHIQHSQHSFRQNRSSHIILRLHIYSRCSYIYLSPELKWYTEGEKYFCMCDVQKKMTMKDLIQHVCVEHNGISPYYTIDSTSRQLAQYDKYFYENAKDQTIRSIIALHMSAKQVRFTCRLCEGGNNLTPSYYSKHIMIKHNRIVDPQHHSHILIQAKYNILQLTHYFYLPKKIHNDDDSVKYYCPCQEDQKMNLKDLVEHILKEHKGLSPSYSLDP